ncbi:MAG: hypothetical protein ABIW76_07890 [Fibrobacteria bacterium]
MLKGYLCLAAVLLVSCLSPEEDPPPYSLALSGVYRGDHGGITRTRGVASELILNPDGTFRHFLIDSNSATFTSKGKWKTSNKEMVWTQIARSYFYHGAFRIWDTLSAPDTSYLRNVTDSGFERLEATWDTQFVSTVQWVRYHRFPAAISLPQGTFTYTETYRNGIDTSLIDTAETRLEIARSGPFVQKIFTNGGLTSMDVDSLWIQAGTFLITSRNRYCSYDSAGSFCGNSAFDFEYVARLAHIEGGAFDLWIPPGTSYQEIGYWAEFRKAPSLTSGISFVPEAADGTDSHLIPPSIGLYVPHFHDSKEKVDHSGSAGHP